MLKRVDLYSMNKVINFSVLAFVVKLGFSAIYKQLPIDLSGTLWVLSSEPELASKIFEIMYVYSIHLT